MIRTNYRLTAREWRPSAIPRDRYLDVIEGVCRFSARHQNAEGAIIDPFLKREHQYATPYFAHAVGTLLSAGRAKDLLPNGVRAMEHATRNFGDGRDAIPDQHGEFFIAALTEALDLYAKHVPASQVEEWRKRMGRPRGEVIRGSVNNWETYAMKGDWLRALAGMADRAEVVRYIEGAWTARQRDRFSPAPWFVYHDRTSDPDTLNVEAVGRGNVLALVDAGIRRDRPRPRCATGGGRNAAGAGSPGPDRTGAGERPDRRSRLGGRRVRTGVRSDGGARARREGQVGGRAVSPGRGDGVPEHPAVAADGRRVGRLVLRDEEPLRSGAAGRVSGREPVQQLQRVADVSPGGGVPRAAERDRRAAHALGNRRVRDRDGPAVRFGVRQCGRDAGAGEPARAGREIQRELVDAAGDRALLAGRMGVAAGALGWRAERGGRRELCARVSRERPVAPHGRPCLTIRGGLERSVRAPGAGAVRGRVPPEGGTERADLP